LRVDRGVRIEAAARAVFDPRACLFILTWLSIQAYSKAWSRSLS
jgi:hypothetical protein